MKFKEAKEKENSGSSIELTYKIFNSF